MLFNICLVNSCFGCLPVFVRSSFLSSSMIATFCANSLLNSVSVRLALSSSKFKRFAASHCAARSPFSRSIYE